MGLLEDVSRAMSEHPLVRGIDHSPRGSVRIQTAFLYPDGGAIDVFVTEDNPEEGYCLTDFGQSVETLLDVQVRPWESAARKRYLRAAIENYGVVQDGAALEYTVASIDHLSDGVIRLGQACLRVSDLIFTRRTQQPRSFRTQLRSIVEGTGLDYEPGFKVKGQYDKLVRIDYRVLGHHRESLVLTLASKTANDRAARVFAKWYDIGPLADTEQALTIYDDSNVNAYREEDLRRLEDKSILLPVSKPDAIQERLLNAA